MSAEIFNRTSEHQLALDFEVPNGAQFWRPIHYLGSKLRVLDEIRECLEELDPSLGPVCDLFAGSGTVSLALSAQRRVVASDIQEYSRVICNAILNPAILTHAEIESFFEQSEAEYERLSKLLEPLLAFEDEAIGHALVDPNPLCSIVEHGSLLLSPDDSDQLSMAMRETLSRIKKHAEPGLLLATRYFGGTYFSYAQSLFIDSLVTTTNKSSPEVRDTYLAAVLSMASSLVDTVGKHFAQPIRPRQRDGRVKKHLIRKMCLDRRQDHMLIFKGWLKKYLQLRTTGGHRVIRGDFRQVLNHISDVSIIYADPPYTRDHYSRFYHVLETICLQDFPDVSVSNTRLGRSQSRGIYRTDRHQSPFCIKSQVSEAFTELFEAAARLQIPLLLSYSPFIEGGHPRLMSIEEVSALAFKYYKKIKVIRIKGVSHSKLNKAEFHLKSAKEGEVLILCRD